LPKTLPNATSFNHCTVQIKTDGKTYWIDPTISYQGGDLRSNSYPDYRWGLVVTDDSPGLTRIEPRDAGQITVKETFDIPDFSNAANLTVNTVYEGDEADLIRYQFANSSISELEQNYKNFYAKLYPKIRLRDSLKTVDHPELNKMEVTEYYAIDNFWVDQDSMKHGEKIKADFEALLIESYIYLPKIRIRKMPVSIRHLTNVHQTIRINLPEEWNAGPENGTISTSAFDYTYNYSYFNKVITLDYKYKTKADFIPTEETEEYVKAVDKIYGHVSYMLSYDKTGTKEEELESAKKSDTNGPMVAFVLFYSCVAGYVFYRLYFINIGKEPLEDEIQPVPAALGGWLILPLIGLVIRPFMYLIQLFTSNYFNGADLSRLAALNGYWTFGITFEVIANVTMFLFSILLLILFLSNRNSLPRFYILFLLFTLFISLADTFILIVLLDREGIAMARIIGLVIGCLIWIPYFLVSQRVKETFVIRYKQKKSSK